MTLPFHRSLPTYELDVDTMKNWPELQIACVIVVGVGILLIAAMYL